MKFEDFWGIYLNEDIVENYDIVKNVFSKELEENTIKEYEISEVLLEVLGHYESAQQFDRIVEFTAILKKHNYASFEEVSAYYDDFLINYYCFHAKQQKLEEPVNDFLKSPLKDYDLLLKSLRKLLYYQYISLCDKLIENIYDKIKNSPEIVTGAEFELATIKYYIELEKVYEDYLLSKKFKWNGYKETLEKFDFEIEDEVLESTQLGLTADLKNISSQFTSEFANNRSVSIDKLEKTFMVFMKKQNIDFSISGSIWNYLYEFWENNQVKSQTQYFEIKEDIFKEFIISKSGFIIDYRFESVMILWGSSYVYDFLLEAQLIEITQYEKGKQIIQQFKQELIDENLSELWKYSFVNNWNKPKMVSIEEHEDEKAIFQKYYDTEPEQLQDQSKKGFFIEPNEYANSIFSTYESHNQENKPLIRDKPKIGRNEKVTVEYNDGSIKNGIKYKKVLTDINNGKCKIINDGS